MTDTPESVNLSDVSSRKVDTELLNELRDLFARAEDQKERYDFTWNGKAKAYFEAATPTTKTLRPQPEESYIYADDDYKEKVNTFNDSENLFITGDNLEALKLLQESYLGKIDMIYIDPPYNTGKDFVYHDNFKSTQKDTDVAEGSVDEDGNRLVKNDKNSGRYHSDWLSMMYPRLKLARNLLSDSGVIFVSIDDNEQANLKLLMDGVFGEANFVDILIWKGKGGGQDSNYFVPVYENILVYSKSKVNFKLAFDLIDEDESSYQYFDSHRQLKYKRQLARKWGSNAKREDRPNLYFGIEAPDGTTIFPHLPDGTDGSWRHNKSRLQLEIENGEFEFVKNDNKWILYQKMFASKDGKKLKKFTNLIDDISSGTGTKYVTSLFGGEKYFDYPKPVELIKRFLSMINDDEFIILDFFAGSGTTADAVVQLNKEDGAIVNLLLRLLMNQHQKIQRHAKQDTKQSIKFPVNESGVQPKNWAIPVVFVP